MDALDGVLARMTALDGFLFSIFITSDDLRKLLLAKGYTDLPTSAVTIQKRVMNYCENIRANNCRIKTFEKCSLKDSVYLLTSGHQRPINDIWLSTSIHPKNFGA